jgi:WD40 repeat protein
MKREVWVAVLVIGLILIGGCVVKQGWAISPDKYVFIEHIFNTDGEVTAGGGEGGLECYKHEYIDFPTYEFENRTKTLSVGLWQGEIPNVNDTLKIVYGTGYSQSGAAGSGASTWLVGVYELPYKYSSTFKIMSATSDGAVSLLYNNKSIELKSGETWENKTVSWKNETGWEYVGWNATCRVKVVESDRITNYGILEKFKILEYHKRKPVYITTLTPTPTSTPSRLTLEGGCFQQGQQPMPTTTAAPIDGYFVSGKVHYWLSVAWSPDGTKIASGSADRTIEIWNASSCSMLRNLSGHSDYVSSVAWSPDGTKIASVSYKTINIWNASSGSLLRNLSGHSGYLLSVAWSPDGTKLVSGSEDNTIKIWDASSGSVLKTLSGHDDEVRSVAWSPDGTKIASGSYDKTIKIWDVSSGSVLKTLSGHNMSVYSVAWSPDGTKIASGSWDETVRIWNASSGSLLRNLSGHSDYVYPVAWSPDGTKIASGSLDGIIKIWNVSSGSVLKTLSGHNMSVRSVAWNPDGTKIASAGFDDGTIKIWNLTEITPTLIHTPTPAGFELLFTIAVLVSVAYLIRRRA